MCELVTSLMIPQGFRNKFVSVAPILCEVSRRFFRCRNPISGVPCAPDSGVDSGADSGVDRGVDSGAGGRDSLDYP